MKNITSIDRMTIDILESVLDNVMVYNSEGVLLYACDKFWAETGLDPDEFAGKGIAEIKEMGSFEPFAAERTLKTGEKATVITRAFNKEIAVATALPITTICGEMWLIVSYAENNNRIVELERKLAQAREIIEHNREDISLLLSSGARLPDVPGQSPAVLKVHKLIERIMDFDATILLTGETGVGKSMYAKTIHAGSGRGAKPFVEINCAAIPEALLESELFGYEKGAFTGADAKGKKGQIEMARGGTLFLDEISELGMKLQSKLLKVIQDKKITRVGGTSEIEVDFRLIVASNKDLEELAHQGLFRSDLFFRLNVIPINVPALRDRKEDIYPLAQQFLSTFNQKYNAQKYFGADVVGALEQYEWPGNVRELQNAVERLVLTAEGNRINIYDMPFDVERIARPEADWLTSGEPGDYERGDDTSRAKAELSKAIREYGMVPFLEWVEKEVLLEAYEEFDGNISEMARRLHLTRQSVLRRIEKYNIG